MASCEVQNSIGHYPKSGVVPNSEALGDTTPDLPLSNSQKKSLRLRDDRQGVPLRHALARFITEFADYDEKASLIKVSEYTKFIYSKSSQLFWLAGQFLFFLCLFSLFIVSCYIVVMFKTHSFAVTNAFLGTGIILPVIIFGGQFYRHVHAYGWSPPDAPLSLSCLEELDKELIKIIEVFLSELRGEHGVEVYYLRRIQKDVKPRFLNRRVFFGRYCHFLFSEHSHILQGTPLFGSPFACHRELFITDADLQLIIKRSRKKLAESPESQDSRGRIPDGHFEAALIRLLPELLHNNSLPMDNEDRAVSKLHGMLVPWLREYVGVNGSMPKHNDVRRHAITFYRALKLVKEHTKENV